MLCTACCMPSAVIERFFAASYESALTTGNDTENCKIFMRQCSLGGTSLDYAPRSFLFANPESVLIFKTFANLRLSYSLF